VTDRRTDRQTDGIAIAIAASNTLIALQKYAYRAARLQQNTNFHQHRCSFNKQTESLTDSASITPPVAI